MRLVPREPLWEQHDSAEKPTCMSINDMLRERQHVTAVTQDTHVPADFDMLAQQARLAVERWTCSPLGGFTSDFTRLSYNKLPHLTVAAWNPHCASEVFGSGVAQLWSEICCEAFCTACAEAIAVWFFDPFTHCVDDMLLVRRLPPFASAWTVWQTFACLCGW